MQNSWKAKQFTTEAYMEVKPITKSTWDHEKKFETGLMLFDAELRKTVIMQTDRYKRSCLGIYPA